MNEDDDEPVLATDIPLQPPDDEAQRRMLAARAARAAIVRRNVLRGMNPSEGNPESQATTERQAEQAQADAMRRFRERRRT